MAKILYKKKIYDFEKDCEDEFGKYHFYLKAYICFSSEGITYQIRTPDFTTNNKKLKNCIDDILKHLEEDCPRYYRLKDKIYSENLHNKLW